MQLGAYANASRDPNTIFINQDYETMYAGLDINLYKSLNRTTDDYDAVFSDIHPNATNLNERKELLLFYANKLTNEETENSKFMIICSTDRITDFFKWIGKPIILSFLNDKFPTNTDKENNQIIQELYKETPDVQFASMQEAINSIAENARWQLEDNTERMRHYAAMNNVLSSLSENVQRGNENLNNTLGQLSENVQRGNEALSNNFGQLSQNLQQGNETLDNTLGRLSADMRRGNMNVSDNLAQLVENTRRRNLEPENQEALQIINDLE